MNYLSKLITGLFNNPVNFFQDGSNINQLWYRRDGMLISSHRKYRFVSGNVTSHIHLPETYMTFNYKTLAIIYRQYVYKKTLFVYEYKEEIHQPERVALPGIYNKNIFFFEYKEQI